MATLDNSLSGDDIIIDVSDINSGTGAYDSFLRVQANATETGYNTDETHVLDNKDGVWTHSIQFQAMQIVNIGGIDYYQIRLDLNEGNASGDENITMTELQLYKSSTAAVSVSGSSDVLDTTGLTKVFDLDGVKALVDLHTGSGTDDYQLLIPVSLFAGAAPTDYFTLAASFSSTDGGFEEFRVLPTVITLDPSITIDKVADPIVINEGTPTDVTYTYTVLNTTTGGIDPLHLTYLFDDNGTVGTGDDVNLLTGFVFGSNYGSYYTGGDTDGDYLIDQTETWTFSYTHEDLVLNADETLTNVVVVKALDIHDTEVTHSDDAVVTGVNVLPSINIDKTVAPTLIQAGGASVTYHYAITNTGVGTDPLLLTSLIDDHGTPLDNSDDFNLLAGFVFGSEHGTYYTGGDTDGDYLIETGETWTFDWLTNVNIAANTSLTNIVYVQATDDEGNSASDNDDATVTALDGPGVRTPGFWASKNGQVFWDGNDTNNPKAGTTGFAAGDLLYSVDRDHDGALDGEVGLLLGDWNHNGKEDAGENTLFITTSNALSLLNASDKQQQDGRWILGRDMIATWLNFLAGNGVGTDPPTPYDHSPRQVMNDAVTWMIAHTNGDHTLDLGGNADKNGGGGPVKTSSAAWTNINVLGLSGQIDHTLLDYYNNTGFMSGHQFANDADP